MARCPHKNVDCFEICLDCGRNQWESDQEYLKYLKSQLDNRRRSDLSERIEQLERELGIKHSGNSSCHNTNGQ